VIGSTLTLLQAAPVIAVFAPERADAGEAVEISIRVRSEVEIERVVAVVGDRILLASKDGEIHRLSIPGALVHPGVSVVIEASDREGSSSARVPIRIDPRSEVEPDATPIERRWWFWSILGVAVLGALAVGISTAVQGDTREVVFRVRPPD
jgi:hypothetical protein